MAMTIQDVIDTIIAAIPGAPLKNTVDVVKTGDPSQPVTGIVTTFLATYEVIQHAVERGANLIITHEPTFYSHRDEVEWLAGDPVYEAKRRLLDDHGIVVWRFHDYWHHHRPDGIMVGVLRQLRWEEYADPKNLSLCTPCHPPGRSGGSFQGATGDRQRAGDRRSGDGLSAGGAGGRGFGRTGPYPISPPAQPGCVGLRRATRVGDRRVRA